MKKTLIVLALLPLSVMASDDAELQGSAPVYTPFCYSEQGTKIGVGTNINKGKGMVDDKYICCFDSSTRTTYWSGYTSNNSESANCKNKPFGGNKR